MVNRQKNAKKKAPTPLTEDMLNELNKNHMGGFENYGAEDLYNMEDVWNDRGYDPKLPSKKVFYLIFYNNFPYIKEKYILNITRIKNI